MSRLKPLVRERFKSFSSKYDEVAIRYDGNNLYRIVGFKKVLRSEFIEPVSGPMTLKMARKAMWDYAEVQDGLPVKVT